MIKLRIGGRSLTFPSETEILGFHLFLYTKYYIINSLHLVQMRATSKNNFERYMFSIGNRGYGSGKPDPCDRWVGGPSETEN